MRNKMDIKVEYKDKQGNVTNPEYSLSGLAFVKHLACAGMHYAPRAQKLLRIISMFLHYNPYMQRQAFYNNRFSEPPICFSDPTENGQFSNLAGKAIADFLSKKINGSIYTVNYEAAMRMHIPPIPLSNNGKQVKRPDLLAFSKDECFAIEAKGYSSGGCANMKKHKAQSMAGGIKVNFSIASVSYNLYNEVKCKYHDPFNDNIPYDNELLKRLTKKYYNGLLDFLNPEYFSYKKVKIQGEEFYEVTLINNLLRNYFINIPFFPFEWLEYYQPSIIIPINILEYAENGITNEIEPFIFESKEQIGDTYIDNDRIGIRIRGYHLL